jgi:hypothetical protein
MQEEKFSGLIFQVAVLARKGNLKESSSKDGPSNRYPYLPLQLRQRPRQHRR